MIHLFSCNFLFGWMMEHCREDKLCLQQNGEITEAEAPYSLLIPFLFLLHL